MTRKTPILRNVPNKKSSEERLVKFIFTASAVCVALTLTSPAYARSESAAQNQSINVYSYRQPFLVKPLFGVFTRKTGIAVKVVFASKGLIARAALEGKNSPVDVILTTDIANLVRAAETIAQPVFSKTLAQHIPAYARDAQMRWFGLTLRARVAYVSRARVAQKSVTYEELADPKWRGRVCTRSGQHPYNIALFSSLIAHHGTDWARNWLASLNTNLAYKPSGNDRAQIRNIYGGACDLALANTYYMGKMQTNDKNPEQKKWAKSVRIIFPNNDTRGAHVNLSGMVMAKYAPHPKLARQFMEFLISKEAQEIYAKANFEYPIRKDVKISKRVDGWGEMRPDRLDMGIIAKNSPAASALVDEVRFNDTP